MEQDLRVLIVEDQPVDAELCEHELRRAGLSFESRRVWTRDTFARALADFPPDLILSDFSMPSDLDGFTALGIARECSPDTPFVFVSGTIGEERAVEAMKAGATDYVLKDRLSRLGPVVKRALKEAQDRRSIARAEHALHDSEARFRSFMRHLPGRASIRDRDGRYTYVNEVWQDYFELKAEDVLGESYSAVWDPARSAELKALHETVLASNQPVKRVVHHGTGENATWSLAHHFPIPGSDGKPAMIGAISIDITEQKLQEEKLERLSRIHAVLSGINSAIVRIRDRGKLLYEACRIAVDDGDFGMAWIGIFDSETGAIQPVASAGLFEGEKTETSALVVSGRPQPTGLIASMLEQGKPAICNDMIRGGSPSERSGEAIRRGYRSVVILPLKLGGQIAGCFALYAPEPNSFTQEEMKLLMELAADVSFALEYIEKDQKLVYLAWHDPVTGLGNRTLLHDQLTHAIQAAPSESMAVVVWDIKRFRVLNNTYGRDVGDALLREIGTRVERAWPGLACLARLSADYFGGFIEHGTRPSDVAHMVEQAAASMSQPLTIDGHELRVDTCAGIAFWPADGGGADVLLANAEAALKQAKARREPYLFYEAAMNARVAEKLRLENRLRCALERNELVLHYQPKIQLATGAVSGVEALLRWDDGSGALVPPAQLIPLLEETGLILEVGRWAIAKALDDRKTRLASGLPAPRVAVNVSAIQLRRPDFIDVLEKALGDAGAAADGLELEITETILMENIGANSLKLRALQDLGVHVAIDDFGTGYSSLSYLSKLPVSSLKIDRSFIKTMMDQPQSMTIVSIIISLAHALHLSVVAEGVETPEQSRVLRALGCDEVQGFLFSQPLPWHDCLERCNAAACVPGVN